MLVSRHLFFFHQEFSFFFFLFESIHCKTLLQNVLVAANTLKAVSFVSDLRRRIRP